MDAKRKQELMWEYKNRKPEMGVISFRCTTTGESFLGISTDTHADFNSMKVKLNSYHPNKRLSELWKQYGETGFEISVIRTLKYEDPAEDHTAKLEQLREECFAADPHAKKIWK